MRGKVHSQLNGLFKIRITPAHAGKSTVLAVLTGEYQDHPRTCGEKHLLQNLLLMSPGSPPHMRGKDFKDVGKIDVFGITPAHAGKR